MRQEKDIYLEPQNRIYIHTMFVMETIFSKRCNVKSIQTNELSVILNNISDKETLDQQLKQRQYSRNQTFSYILS